MNVFMLLIYLSSIYLELFSNIYNILDSDSLHM